MIRTYVLAVVLTSGTCFVTLGQWGLVDRQSGWDPREARSEMLDQKSSLHVRRATHTDISATVSRWERPRFVRAVARADNGDLRPNGAHISLTSLTSFSSTLPTCEVEPDNNQPVPFSSVIAGPIPNSICSSLAGVARQTCSVKNSSKSSCSATGAPNSAYCSTGTNGGGPNNNTCSVILSSSSTCSALAGAGDTCSTQSNTGAGYCSVTGPASPVQTNSSCSTGSQSGAPAKPAATDSCSALPPSGNGNASNGTTCSIYNIGLNGGKQTATCSADGNTGSSCSVLSSKRKKTSALSTIQVEEGTAANAP